jgi:hypothetical protein
MSSGVPRGPTSETAPKPPEPAPVAADGKSSQVPLPDDSVQLEVNTNPPTTAQVFLDGELQGMTDSKGHLEITLVLDSDWQPQKHRNKLPSWNYNLSVDAPNYENYHATVELHIGLNRTSVTLVPLR